MDGCLVRNGVVRVAGCSINEFGVMILDIWEWNLRPPIYTIGISTYI